MKKQVSTYEKYIKKLLKDYTRVNLFSPFPFYDTELVETIEKKVNTIMAEKKDYDSLPVVCCKHCKELTLQDDEIGNDVCLRCGAVGNDIAEIHENIFEYGISTGKKID